MLPHVLKGFEQRAGAGWRKLIRARAASDASTGGDAPAHQQYCALAAEAERDPLAFEAQAAREEQEHQAEQKEQ